MRLNIENKVTKAKYDFTVTDKQTSGIYYVFDIQLPSGIDDGDYEYNLYDDDKVLVATGYVRIGDYTPETSAYTGNNGETFIQYAG